MSKQLLVTVGTTNFDLLLNSLDTKEFYNTLITHGYNSVIFQKGNGSFVPNKENFCGIKVKTETFVSNFENLIEESDLIISHAGAGSILEGLRHKKRLIVCANPSLMDDHQKELASELHKGNFLWFCEDLGKIVEEIKAVLEGRIEIKEYEKGEPGRICRVIYEMMGMEEE